MGGGSSCSREVRQTPNGPALIMVLERRKFRWTERRAELSSISNYCAGLARWGGSVVSRLGIQPSLQALKVTGEIVQRQSSRLQRRVDRWSDDLGDKGVRPDI